MSVFFCHVVSGSICPLATEMDDNETRERCEVYLLHAVVNPYGPSRRSITNALKHNVGSMGNKVVVVGIICRRSVLF